MSKINNIESSLTTRFSFGPSAFSSDNLSPKFRSAQNWVTDADVASTAALRTRQQVGVVRERENFGAVPQLTEVSLKTGAPGVGPARF